MGGSETETTTSAEPPVYPSRSSRQSCYPEPPQFSVDEAFIIKKSIICVMYLVGKLNSEAFLGIRVDHSIGNKSPWGWPGINHRPSLHTYFYWNGVGGNGQKSPSSKTAVLLAASRRARPLLTRGAYSLYVSTTKWRERCWRLFSTFPPEEVRSAGRVTESEIRRNQGKISF